MTRTATAILLVGCWLVTASRIARADEPTVPQCIAANEDAQQLRRAGKLLQARERLRVCVAHVCPGPIRDDCNTWIGEVTEAIPTVVLEARDSAGKGLIDVHVSMDGMPLAESLNGRSISVDPGAHVFVFDATGIGRQTLTMVVFEGKKLQTVAAALSPIAVASPSNLRPAPSPLDGVPPPSVAAEAPGPARWPVAIAWGFAAAGAAVAGVSGALAASTRSQCPNNVCPTQNLIDTAQTDARVADIGIGVAVVGAALGVALLLFLPSQKNAVTAHIAPGGGGIEVRFP